MAVEIIMPRVDMDMTEGKIAFWYVRNGDRVKKGQTLFDIETDKATMEVDAEADGIIDGIREELGVPVPVGEPVAWLLAEGEALPGAASLAAEPPVAAPSAPAVEAGPEVALAEAEPPVAAGSGAGPLRATPLARATSRRNNVDLAGVRGSGPQGAVLARDLPARRSEGAPGLHLQWLARGDGAPLVLLHGFGADLGAWRPLASLLGGVPVVGVDLPNHGKSPRGPVRSLDEIAERVDERLLAEGIDAVHVAGHSLGGGVAMALSARLGARLRSLTLIAPVGLGPSVNGEFVGGLCQARSESALRAWLRETVADDRLLTGSFVATAWQQVSAEDRQPSLLAMAQGLMPHGTQLENLRSRLLGLQVPLKVIWGLADRIVPPHHADTLPPHAALHRLAGVGHLPQVEAADLTAMLLRQQLAAGR